MGLNYLSTAVGLAASLLLVATAAKAAPDASLNHTSVRTAQSWQPIARINPQKPYKIQLVNQTQLDIEFATTTSEFSPRRLAPGGSTSLDRLALPVYLLISAVDPSFGLTYSISAKQNTVMVKIQPLPQNRPGNTTVNIQETGGIYIY